MAYGEDIYNLSFGDIAGAHGGSVESAQNIMSYIFNTLKTGGYERFGSGWGEEGEDPYDWFGEGRFGGIGEEYNIQDWMSYLDPEETYGSSTLEYGGWEEGGIGAGMSERLLSVLQKLNIPGLMQSYGQDIGDVGAEIGSQREVLGKSLTGMGKSSRYGSLATGGKLAGGRKKYLSDYYGLEQQEGELTTGLQTEVEEDINQMMMDYLSLHPST